MFRLEERKSSLTKNSRARVARVRLPRDLLLGLFPDTVSRVARRRHREIDKKNWQLIEHYLRKGRKQLEMLSSQEVTGMHLHPAGSGGGGSGASGGGSSSSAGRGA